MCCNDETFKSEELDYASRKSDFITSVKKNLNAFYGKGALSTFAANF